MMACEQAPGITILQHGLLVRNFYGELISHLRDGLPLRSEWRLPDWIRDPLLIEDLPDDCTMAQYHVNHDCGKPFCITFDEDGKRHFPDHAAVSQAVWLSIGGDPFIGELIAQDMDIHTIKDSDVASFSKRKYACAQLLTGLAEIHANASMFGGIESTSFKIKYKQIDKRGAAILRVLKQR